MLEYLFDCHFEQIGNLERERQRRIIFTGFDRVDALPGNLQPPRQLRLRPEPISQIILTSIVVIIAITAPLATIWNI